MAAALVVMLAAGGACHRAAPAVEGAKQTLTVAPRPFAQTITLVGMVTTGDGESVVAPFDGTVRSIAFTYGQRVRAGQLLATFDTAELIDQRSGAEADYLKAQQTMGQLTGWISGPEMAGARRAQAAAAMELQVIDRDLAQTRSLLDKGLVPRDEYDALVQRRRGQQLAMTAAADDYRATLSRGGGTNFRIAQLELQRTRAKLAELDRAMQAASLRARSDGIIVRPPQNGDQPQAAFGIGTRLTRGQPIAAIARSAALAVAFKLDETDVNRVHVGQPVTVTGPAFDGAALSGRVAEVGGEAIASTTPVTKATFAATARLDPTPPALAATIRLGMTATITIETYSAPAAIVVPAAAVNGTAPTASVTVQRDGAVESRTVTVGQVAADEVEIRAGLKPGETIVWHDTPAPPATE